MSNTKHDCFVGNLSYNTTEEGLREVFSVVGEVKNIRICTDRETGRPKGYAFIEYADAATALSAIRNLDTRDFNGRKLRVSYSNNSSLKDVAREMGHVVQDSYQSGKLQRHTHLPMPQQLHFITPISPYNIKGYCFDAIEFTNLHIASTHSALLLSRECISSPQDHRRHCECFEA
jgi:cleavage stimulation factor subunit 2